MLPTFFELPPILQVLLGEVVDPAAFDVFADPGAVISIAVGKNVLRLYWLFLGLFEGRERFTCVYFRCLFLLALPFLLLDDLDALNGLDVQSVRCLLGAAHRFPGLLVRGGFHSFGLGFEHFILLCFFELGQGCFLSRRQQIFGFNASLASTTSHNYYGGDRFLANWLLTSALYYGE